MAITPVSILSNPIPGQLGGVKAGSGLSIAADGTISLAAGGITNTEVSATAAILSTKLQFTQAGTSATVQTVQDKSRQIVNVKDFGVVGDGVTDDTTALTAALNSLSSGGGRLFVGNGMNILISSNVTVPTNVTLYGQGEVPHGGGYAPNTRFQGCISPSNDASLIMQKGSALYGLTLMKSGLSFSEAGSASFSGTAITVSGTDVGIVNCAILGFSLGISSVGWDRLRATDLNMDCNNCIYLEQAFDIPYITRVHCWPFLSVNTLTAVNNKRTGVAFYFKDGGDWNKVQNCFCYGYLIGFKVENCNNVVFSNCGSDNVPGGYTNSVGFSIIGNSNETKLIGCQAAASQTGYIVNTTSESNYTTFTSCDGWGLTGNGLYILSGSATFIGGTFARLPQGIVVGNTSSYVYITGTAFNALTAGFGVTATAATTRCGLLNLVVASIGSATPVSTLIQTPTSSIFSSNL
jgi:hypothetical protein